MPVTIINFVHSSFNTTSTNVPAYALALPDIMYSECVSSAIKHLTTPCALLSFDTFISSIHSVLTPAQGSIAVIRLL